MKSLLLKFAVFLLLGAVALQAQIYIATVVGNQGSNVQTTLTFTLTAPDLMTVFIDNTIASPTGAKGAFMGFGFNTYSPLDSSELSLEDQSRGLTNPGHTTPLNWIALQQYQLNGSSGLYVREFGSATDTNPNGNGAPENGILFGETATLEFKFNPGYGIAPADFFGPGPAQISGRWQRVQGANGVTSDKGLGTPTLQQETPGLTPVPESSTYGVVAAVGLLTAIGARHRLGKQKSKAA